MNHILVTGGAGFIGSHFVHYLLGRYPGARVTTFDKLTYAGNTDNLRGVDSARHHFVKGDIADAGAVKAAMRPCDAVVNFAAETHVDRSIHGAGDFIETDVRGVYNIVEAARELGAKRVLLVSTDEVYGSIAEGSFTEDAPLGPRNPYAASKAGGEMMGRAHFHTFGAPVIVTRGSNTYGPNQYPEKMLPLFITNALDDEPLPLYGDGRNVRDWLFVTDHCAGIDCALRKGAPGEVYNIAGGNERENLDVTRRILALLGKPDSLIQPVADRPGHDRRYSIAADKLRALGWEPETPWEEGLAATVRWYRDNAAWWRPIKSGQFRAYYERQYGGR